MKCLSGDLHYVHKLYARYNDPSSLQKRLRIRSVISVNYHYITFMPF